MKRESLQKILGSLTKRIVAKYNPKVVAITGSVGKTSTKNAIALLLEKNFTVWGKSGNLNTEFGVPLAFMGKDKGGGDSFWRWGKIILFGIHLLVKKRNNYPDIVIAEMGADRPGDISYLTSLIKPDISIITMIGEIPVHLENYGSIQEVTEEKARIIEGTKPGGFIILNSDDPKVKEMGKNSNSILVYYGFDEGADVRISDFTIETRGSFKDKTLYGSSFKLTYKGRSERIHLPYCIGKPSAYSVAAAYACGMAMGIDLSRFADIFRDLKPEEGRMNFIEANNYSVIDDTYNASPASVESALETIKEIPARRKIVILGDMKELGDRSSGAHRKIGKVIPKVADLLVTVGDLAEEIKEAAISSGMELTRVSSFKTAHQAVDRIKSIAREGDLILVKGSRSMKMEEIVKEIT